MVENVDCSLLCAMNFSALSGIAQHSSFTKMYSCSLGKNASISVQFILSRVQALGICFIVFLLQLKYSSVVM